MDLRAPAGAEVLLNYRLKDVVRQLLRKRMPYFPGAIERVPYTAHRTYLACDLLGTRALYDHLWPRLGRVGQRYYQEIVAPLIPVLLAMTEAGVAADADFIRAESDRLGQLMERLSAEHGTYTASRWAWTKSSWAAGSSGRSACRCSSRPARHAWVPSLDAEALHRLEAFNEDPRVAGSLQLMREYHQAAGLLVRLRAFRNHIDPRTGRIHSTFDDRQATGRLSSTYPNLQQLAKKRELAKTEDTPASRSAAAMPWSPRPATSWRSSTSPRPTSASWPAPSRTSPSPPRSTWPPCGRSDSPGWARDQTPRQRAG